MLTLILETSSEKGIALLSQNGTPIRHLPLPSGPSLSTQLAVHVQTLLSGQIPELIAVGTGPGSYTGIRVGVSLAKALSYGWQIPLIGFCSLTAFAQTPILVDARSNGFYALFDDTPQLISAHHPTLSTLSLVYSPHPELIQKRLSHLLCREVHPSPPHLAAHIQEQFCKHGVQLFEIPYLLLEKNSKNS